MEVRGTRGDDTVSIQVESPDRANVIINGSTVASLSDGDTLTARTGPGNDVLSFGPVDEEDFPFNLNARFGGGRDRLSFVLPVDPEMLVRTDGGPGDDRLSLTGEAGATIGYELVARGGLGADQITVTLQFPGSSPHLDGGGGNDVLKLTDAPANTRDARAASHFRGGNIAAGDGNDMVITRGDGGDRLFGGRGDDELTARGLGPDRLYGNLGDDILRVRGGGRDRVSCDGSTSAEGGNDVVVADRRDVVAADCETVKRR